MSVKILKEKDYVIKKVYDLIPYADNPRDHTESLPELIKSIKERGFYQPLIIDQKNRIVCGHGRLKAAVELEMEELPCIVIQLNDEEYIRTMLSDNKITELTRYTNKTLKVCLQIVGALENRPAGFKEDEIAKLFGHSIPAAPEKDVREFKKKSFQFTTAEHEEITGKLKVYMKEHDLESETQAIIMMLNTYKGPIKTEIKNGPVKVLADNE